MASGRRELTWTACDALAAAGRKPSIASVREWTLANHGRKQGSDTDTQADINAWYVLLLAMKQEKQTVAGLPEEVAVLARGLWIKANEAASDSLAEHREAIDAELRSAKDAVIAAESETVAAHALTETTRHELAVARESIRRLEDSLSEIRATVQATQVRHEGQLQMREERITALGRDIVQKETEHGARLIELEGLRRHALLQIEEARNESRYWKSECERTALAHQATLEGERKALATAQAEVAGMAGRLSAVEESLQAALQRSESLEAMLAHLREKSPANAPSSGNRRSVTARPVRATAFRRRKE